jgi:hypothetical protein
MKSDEKDVPVSHDYAKSNEAKGVYIPDFLTQKSGAFIGLGAVIVISGIVWAISHVNFSRPASNALESRAGFAALRHHVESLAEVDGLCSKVDRTTCLCELADRMREDHRAIDSLLASDPSLKSFQIVVRRPASVTVSYDLNKLPKAPPEAECLNAVSAPTIIDDDGTNVIAQPATQDAAPVGVPAESEPADDSSPAANH